jgi:hypothetical protein
VVICDRGINRNNDTRSIYVWSSVTEVFCNRVNRLVSYRLRDILFDHNTLSVHTMSGSKKVLKT